MAKAKITVTGTTEKKPKINQDGTVDLIFKGSMSASVPKGLKSLGDSFYRVQVGPKTWKKVSDKFQDDSFLIIQGEPKASKNSKDVPYIDVVCFDISIREVQKKNDNPQEPEENKPAIFEEKKQEPEATKQVVVPEEMSKNNPALSEAPKAEKKRSFQLVKWYEDSEIIELPTADILLIDYIHLSTKTISLDGNMKVVNKYGQLTYPVAVRPLQDRPGKYALVMGLKNYTIAKLLNIEKVKAVIRNMEHKQLINSLGIEAFDKLGTGKGDNV